MSEDKPMPLLLIEDDIAECIRFKEYSNNCADIEFVGITSSSIEGMQLVKSRVPEGIILDLELHKGRGSGLQFLAELRETYLRLHPIIIVTTNSSSNIVYNHIHDIGVDLIFYKNQPDYSAEMVINTMLALRKSLHSVRYSEVPGDLRTIESPEQQRGRIMDRICTELDLIGIGVRYKGRMYLQECIYILLTKNKDTSEAVIYQIADRKKVTYSSVIRAIQTAINRAWAASNIEDLQMHYTARINVHTGVPTPTEFIHFYADKIRKSM